MLEKVPDFWTIASCFQRLNCLNQRGECLVEPKDEIRTEAHGEERLTESQEDGNVCWSDMEREDKLVQQPDTNLAPQTKWESGAKWLLVLLIGVFITWLVYLSEQLRDLSRTADIRAFTRVCAVSVMLFTFSVAMSMCCVLYLRD